MSLRRRGARCVRRRSARSRERGGLRYRRVAQGAQGQSCASYPGRTARISSPQRKRALTIEPLEAGFVAWGGGGRYVFAVESARGRARGLRYRAPSNGFCTSGLPRASMNASQSVRCAPRARRSTRLRGRRLRGAKRGEEPSGSIVARSRRARSWHTNTVAALNGARDQATSCASPSAATTFPSPFCHCLASGVPVSFWVERGICWGGGGRVP